MMIYLDYAATTPMSDRAIAAYNEAARNYFGNASSIHDVGSKAQQIVDGARNVIAQLINGRPRGLFFTGSGSEANTLAIESLALGNRSRGNHIITTGAEHACVRNTMKMLEQQGFEVTQAPLQPDGSVDIDKLAGSIRDETVLFSIHHGNSEVGILQDIYAIGELAAKHDILFHSDCVQTFGKIPLNVQKAKIDSLSISAHKIYGPKGTGASYISPSVRWKSKLPGGSTQEKGFRAGTVNAAAVAAFAAAARDVYQTMEREFNRQKKMKAYLIQQLKDLPFKLTFEGHLENHLPNIVGLRIHGMEGQYAMLECNRYGLAISTGSACSVGTEKASATMVALGKTEQQAREFVRLSFGNKTTKKELTEAVKILNKVLTDHFNMVKL